MLGPLLCVAVLVWTLLPDTWQSRPWRHGQHGPPKRRGRRIAHNNTPPLALQLRCSCSGQDFVLCGEHSD